MGENYYLHAYKTYNNVTERPYLTDNINKKDYWIIITGKTWFPNNLSLHVVKYISGLVFILLDMFNLVILAIDHLSTDFPGRIPYHNILYRLEVHFIYCLIVAAKGNSTSLSHVDYHSVLKYCWRLWFYHRVFNSLSQHCHKGLQLSHPNCRDVFIN